MTEEHVAPPEDTHGLHEPPKHAIDIGGGHLISYSEYKGEKAGIIDWHKNAAGRWCCGWAPFKGSAWELGFVSNPIQAWEVLSVDPLTMSPSLLCRACGSHGFIQNGKWVGA